MSKTQIVNEILRRLAAGESGTAHLKYAGDTPGVGCEVLCRGEVGSLVVETVWSFNSIDPAMNARRAAAANAQLSAGGKTNIHHRHGAVVHYVGEKHPVPPAPDAPFFDRVALAAEAVFRSVNAARL